MAALNRLSQRIRENFAETTRDLNLLATGAGSSSSAYFDTSDEKLKEISKLLESRSERERLEGMKRIIAGISKGRDMERFFAQVVKNVVAPSIEIRKLVYIYLLRFASTNSDLLLLSINTFQKDLSDPSPLIRSMSLRVLTSIRVPVIQGIVMLGLKKLVNDRNPWVRKTVAGGLAKVYEMDSSSLSSLLPLLQTLLASPSPLTLGATLTAFSEICPDRLDLLHPYYRHICRLLVDADEWGQSVALEVLTRYARAMLEKPETAGSAQPAATPKSKSDGIDAESEDEFDGLDIDIAMLLDCARPLFQSRNPAVVLAAARTYYHLAPSNNKAIGQELLVLPLLRLAGSTEGRVAGKEIASLTWEVIGSMVEERPWLFANNLTSFYVHTSEPVAVKTNKIRAMRVLVSEESAQASLREFKYYTRDPSDAVCEEAVRAIGHCVRTQPAIAAAGLNVLMRLLKSSRGEWLRPSPHLSPAKSDSSPDSLVAASVIELKSVALSNSSSLPEPQKLVARLARSLDGISNASARASVFWLVGQFAAAEEKAVMGLGWEGVAPWVPDVLRKGIKGFAAESTIAKLQILTLAAKLLVLAPGTSLLLQLSTYLFMLARYDQDYDVRDRARFLGALLRGVRPDKTGGTLDQNGEAEDEDEDGELGGVVLRREQVRVILMGKRAVVHDVKIGQGEYEVGSMSRAVGKRLAGYEELPEWTDDPTDSSLRDSEIEKQPRSVVPTPPVATPSSASAPVPVHLSPSTSSFPRSAAGASPYDGSPAGSVPTHVKNKFKDLDAFLNSESEEETEDSSEEEERPVQPVTAPPRSAIVPEYDEESSEEESEEETEEENSEDEAERAPLYGRYS